VTELSKIAYIFPGQGSQKVGMGQDLYHSYSRAREVFEEADDALGFPLSQLCFEGPDDALTRTDNVQPAILITSIACLKIARETANDHLPSPIFVAGHSLGEYTALVAADVLSITDAVRLVRHRGRLMHQAGQKKPGGMIALLGASKEDVEDLCLLSGCTIANINCPGQIVISGGIENLDKANKLSRTKGARQTPLRVSGAFHSSLMEPAVGEFSEIVSNTTFHPPTAPIIANVTAQPLDNVDAIKEELLNQLCHCIQWQRSVEYMAQEKVTTFYEIGPGKVLSGLIRRINPELRTRNISTTEEISQLKAD
jgi:[acyl-carrier-protein] S-malonyltransferase